MPRVARGQVAVVLVALLGGLALAVPGCGATAAAGSARGGLRRQLARRAANATVTPAPAGTNTTSAAPLAAANTTAAPAAAGGTGAGPGAAGPPNGTAGAAEKGEVQVAPCQGKGCGDPCASPCPAGATCPAVEWYCQADGACGTDAAPDCSAETTNTGVILAAVLVPLCCLAGCATFLFFMVSVGAGAGA